MAIQLQSQFKACMLRFLLFKHVVLPGREFVEDDRVLSIVPSEFGFVVDGMFPDSGDAATGRDGEESTVFDPLL